MIKANKYEAQRPSFWKPVLTGAAIALTLISAFLLTVKDPNPEWPKLWMLRPLIVVPFAGAMGGLFYYLMGPLRYEGGWKKIIAVTISLLVYIIGLWMGSILGLAGTLWD